MSKVSEKWDEIGDNPLVIVSELKKKMNVDWVQETKEYMQDEDLGSVLDMVVKMMSGNIPEPAKVARICAILEAHAVKFRMQYTAFMSFKKSTTEANMKKNHYKELYTGIDRLVDSLKYLVRI